MDCCFVSAGFHIHHEELLTLSTLPHFEVLVYQLQLVFGPPEQVQMMSVSQMQLKYNENLRWNCALTFYVLI